MTATLCLNMIVRNEAAIVERCLRAAAPHVDCYVVLDTGSTDDTVAIVERVMAEEGVPGLVAHGEFHDFEQARNCALEAARTADLAFDYLLLCDADMDLRVEDLEFREHLTAPAYRLLQRNASIGYQNLRLLHRNVPARYVGVTHEFLDIGPEQAQSLDGAWFWDHAEGSSRAVKFERDIALLTAALREDPSNARYVFYLAQSYRDCGRHREAQETYRRRVALGGWEEEVWYSLLQIAWLAELLEQDEPAVADAYLTAYQFRPTRAEPLVALARWYRENGRRFALAHLVADRARHLPRPSDLLFLDESTYAWRARDEYAIAAYWIGEYAASAEVSSALLADPALPQEQRERVQGNLRFALDHLDGGPPRTVPGPRTPRSTTPGR
ncbi:MAG: glycosyltransferase [Sporichthyaceae bacterium]